MLLGALPAILLLFAALLAGCGAPGEPLPPLLEIPVPVSDLTAVQIGAQVRLTWSVPRLTTEGTRARRQGRMDLYGAFLPEDTSPANFAAQSKLLVSVEASELTEGQQQVAKEVPLISSQVQQRASFAVKASNTKGKSAGFSNAASLDIVDLPGPPDGLQASVTEKAIRLAWKPATASAFGGPVPPIDGYRVYRADAGSPVAAQELGTSTTPSFEDTTFQFGHTYIYSVRAYVGKSQTAATTPPSGTLEKAAIDVFPPSPPRNISAIAVPGAVEMAWSVNAEPDMAGYNVYRRDAGSFSKVNPALLNIPIFRDPSTKAGTRYTYHITAVDKSGNESAPSQDTTVTAE